MSKLDENKLDELKEAAEECQPGPCESNVGQWYSEGKNWSIEPEYALELLRLARLGLWAEKHGIEALGEVDSLKLTCEKFLKDKQDRDWVVEENFERWRSIMMIREALAALPKGDSK